MRNCSSKQNNHMKWKFRPTINLVLKLCTNIFHKSEKCLFRSNTWIIFVKNRYTLVQERWKISPSLCCVIPPLAIPTTKYHEIYKILWKSMTRFPILHIFANFLLPFAFQFALESVKLPKSPNSNLGSTNARFSAHPFSTESLSK